MTPFSWTEYERYMRFDAHMQAQIRLADSIIPKPPEPLKRYKPARRAKQADVVPDWVAAA